MGAWGTAIFSDDTACDVRDGWHDLVGDGQAGSKATDLLLGEYANELDDMDSGPVFWLALAATQWKCGRLEPRVKDRALRVIDDGTDLLRWGEDAKLSKKRRVVLDKLRGQLLSDPPPAKRIPKTYRSTCEWEVGEVLSYRLRSGKVVLFRVLRIETSKGGASPLCEFFDWIGDRPPPAGAIARLPRKSGRVQIGRLSDRELPTDRINRLGVKLPVEESGSLGCGLWLWRMADERLEQAWGYK